MIESIMWRVWQYVARKMTLFMRNNGNVSYLTYASWRQRVNRINGKYFPKRLDTSGRR